MSMALYQNVLYGYKTTYKRFAELVGDAVEDDYDDLLAWNREDRTGWLLTESDEAFYGKIILEGENAGHGELLAAESGCVEIPKIEKQWQLDKAINDAVPEAYVRDIKTYIIGVYL